MPGQFHDVHFTQSNIPQWCCPGCLNESLEIVKGSFIYHPSGYSVMNRHEDWYNAEHEEFVFICMLQCSRRSCMESVAVSGTGSTEQEPDERGENLVYTTWFQAKSFVPPLPFFNIPDACPDNIKRKLRTLSALLPVSGKAAINAMRSVLEDLLDNLAIPNEIPRKNRVPLVLTLHNRIEGYEALLGDHYAAFIALKWLGNSGSHGRRRLKKSDIKDACEILDDLLQRIYPRDSGVAEKIARLYNGHAPKTLSK